MGKLKHPERCYKISPTSGRRVVNRSICICAKGEPLAQVEPPAPAAGEIELSREVILVLPAPSQGSSKTTGTALENAPRSVKTDREIAGTANAGSEAPGGWGAVGLILERAAQKDEGRGTVIVLPMAVIWLVGTAVLTGIMLIRLWWAEFKSALRD